MEDLARGGPRTVHQWYSTSLASSRGCANVDKMDGRNSDGVGGLGTGALHFIRNRGSVRRQLKRDGSTRNKSSGEGHATTLTSGDGNAGSSNGVGGFGKWLRDHLGGGSRNNQEIVASVRSKNRGNNASYDFSSIGSDKNLARTTYTPQNLYCSLPREQHRRHFHGSTGKSNHEIPREHSRFYAVNFRERAGSSDLANITRGGPVYGSEGKSMRRRERERRRHSMNETRVHGRQDRIRQSVVSLEVRNVDEEVDDAEEVDGKVLSPRQYEVNGPNALPADVSDGDLLTLGTDEVVVETPKVIGEVIKTEDSSGSYEEFPDSIEESEESERFEKIDSREKYEKACRRDSGRFFVDDDNENEEDEEVYCAESSSAGREKFEDEDAPEDIESEEPDDETLDDLDGIPMEILRDRRALIEKLRELKKEEPILRRRNGLLQGWVARLMTKKYQTMAPEDPTLNGNEMNDRYVKRLISCKSTIDEIEARQGEIRIELDNLANNRSIINDEDSVTFGKLLDREREIGVGLVFEKTGRAFGARAIEAMIRRQVLRRDLLNGNRFQYIFSCHRYEDLKTKLRQAETLGDGMTIMDYEAIRMENENNKKKLDERDKDLDSLRAKVDAAINTLAHYKEKDFSNLADIEREKNRLGNARSEKLRSREEASKTLQVLWRIRNACARKKRRGGLLFAIPVLRKMETVLKSVDELKVEIERMSQNASSRTGRKLDLDENRTSVTRMTKVKSEEPRKMRPGRC